MQYQSVPFRLSAAEIRSIAELPLNVQNIRDTLGIEDWIDNPVVKHRKKIKPRPKNRRTTATAPVPSKEQVAAAPRTQSPSKEAMQQLPLPPMVQPSSLSPRPQVSVSLPEPVVASHDDEDTLDESSPRYGDLLSDWAM
jgi:hypothetical protein